MDFLRQNHRVQLHQLQCHHLGLLQGSPPRHHCGSIVSEPVRIVHARAMTKPRLVSFESADIYRKRQNLTAGVAIRPAAGQTHTALRHKAFRNEDLDLPRGPSQARLRSLTRSWFPTELISWQFGEELGPKRARHSAWH